METRQHPKGVIPGGISLAFLANGKEMIYLNLQRDNFTAANLKFPIVIIDRSVSNSDVDVVALDNVDAAYLLTTHLRGLPQIT